jgi:hypothetical protein
VGFVLCDMCRGIRVDRSSMSTMGADDPETRRHGNVKCILHMVTAMTQAMALP